MRRTRSSNKDVNFNIYYSKKVPQQVHFPHRKKTIRRRSTPVRDESKKRQMVFLPEKMRTKSEKTIKDSDSEGEYEEVEERGGDRIDLGADEEDEAEQSLSSVAKERVGKRKIHTMKEEDEEEEKEPVRPTPKRRRGMVAPKHERHARQTEAEHGTPAETEGEGARNHILRRQSTMTQLVNGRRPLPNSEEPEFKPIKRSPRLSWSRKSTNKEKDKQQRTLTQMMPGMPPFEIMSDEDREEALSDLEAQGKDIRAYEHAVAQRLAQQGLHQVQGGGSDEATVGHQARESEQWLMNTVDDQDELQVHPQSMTALVVESVEEVADQDDKGSYQPTQHIDAPITRTTRALRRKNERNQAQPLVDNMLPLSSSIQKSRFSLLSTPEKRRIREIPSSQSPADSPLLTQVSDEKSNRSPLKEQSGNGTRAPETPSKRKQVTFGLPLKPRSSPPILGRFQSTIQDSEEEDEDIIEEDEPSSAQCIGVNMHGRPVGSHTQAMLDQIDQACAHADEHAAWQDRGSSEELSLPTATRSIHEASPELGEQQEQPIVMQQKHILHARPSYRTAHAGIKQEPLHDIETLDLTTELYSTPPFSEPSPQDTFPSTPMVIQDDSSNEEDGPDPMPPSQNRQIHEKMPSSSSKQTSIDLDDEPVQVPRSPSTQAETQQSHSSKAEQQLQNEWLSYSQYLYTRPPQSSSMHVGPDAFSYSATPMHIHPTAAQSSQALGPQLSQATTVDELTPKRNRVQRTMNASVTPHKKASSQVFVSPNKLPPLFIPSSFPSPAKAAIEGWSSPMYGRTQDLTSSQFGATLEDFSIPLPPPLEDE
ncbi:uncharacterized protein K460DRAFT_283848 [Cucurbitaria berberidis CBS 394.84]|uniref:Uncharacterized protein n=1 Tax=Cucurbitaria berberidis CBS 394.84 TaxID=1168544 RepID=A0A9P4GHG5_9PLEO|nr:uncharacterized protein K460DRAFT_283848 [Cucurbitaria berberidis CBS 394.84]KAF1845319.1 hypothetical protein K460DRAFT_283848 [Cucurbitaria berberidis CBS 394.84]